jgi:LysM repeat protein
LIARAAVVLWVFFFGLVSLDGQTPPIHTVRAGETVYAIAKQYDTAVAEILKANPGLNPSRIHAGDKIRLPGSTTPATQASAPSSSPPTTAKSLPPSTSSLVPTTNPATSKTWIKVQKGDTLSKVARENSVKVEDLRKWNRLSGDTIRPGEALRIRPPGASVTSPAFTPKPPAPAPTPKKAAEPEWQFVGPARSQIEAPKNRLRDWEYIVVHHSGTSGGNAKVFDYYHSEERGMENGMAYHFVIGNGTDSGDGQIEVGRRWLKQIQGGHLASEMLNEISIGICLVGDFSRSRVGPRQTASLIELVQYLRKMMPEDRLKFRLHREINTRPTECPGRLFPARALHEILR